MNRISHEVISDVANAIDRARCPHREGPFGGYLYDDLHVIRDFRDPASPDWGKWLHRTTDTYLHEELYAKMTREYIASEAILAFSRWNPIDSYQCHEDERIMRPHKDWGPIVVRYCDVWVSADNSTRYEEKDFHPFWKHVIGFDITDYGKNDE